MNLIELLNSKIVIIDGAMGTMIQKYKLTEEDFRGEIFKDHNINLKGNNDILCLTKPEIIYEIHRKYLEAGANIIETNTFNANSISQNDYKTEKYVYEINKAAASIAKKAVKEYYSDENPRYVAGAIGPTNKTLSISPDVNNPTYKAINFDTLVESYYEQIIGLIDGGVDILLVETIFDTLNAKAAVFAAKKYMKAHKKSIPLMISGTISDAAGRTLSGQTVEAFYTSLQHSEMLSIGLNCSFGAEQMKPYIERLVTIAECYVSVYPNAGLPNAFGQYEQTPEYMGSLLEDYFKENLINIVGGCCGTTPEHIKAIAEIAKKYKPRKLPQKKHITRISGLEDLIIDKTRNFINVGERTNVAGSRKFAKLIREKNYEEAITIAREQIENGAQIIDICMDDPLIDAKEAMTTFLNFIATESYITTKPVMIDSSSWETIEAALKCIQGKPIVNSISLKDGEKAFLEKAEKIREYGAAVIVMAFDEEGQAETYERKIQICQRAYFLLTEKLNFPPEDIIFDPNIFAIATGIDSHNNYAYDYIRAVEWIKKNLPYSKVSGGVSNLSFSFRGNDYIRSIIHSVFLYHAINAGMDMGIVNTSHLIIYDQIPQEIREVVTDIIFNRKKDAVEKLIQYAQNTTNKKIDYEKENIWKNLSTIDRIKYYIINGIKGDIEQDLTTLVNSGHSALSIIEGPLMEGMKEVGQLFGNGKMFLPQVIKSARIMKYAVSLLTPILEKEKKTSEKSSGKILLATVKGDVHDIGKNIVSLLLSCNNYEVIDAGVMVPCEKILEIAKKENVDIIALSGLITPSLDEMIHVAEEMDKQGFTIPLVIGGASTSKEHTALKISDKYKGPVIHVKDASSFVNVANNLLSENKKEKFIQTIKEEYEKIKQEYLKKETEKNDTLTLAEARKNKYISNFQNITPPRKLNIEIIKDITIHNVRPFINWTSFFHSWKLNGQFPEILENQIKKDEANKLYNDANKLLDIAERNNLFNLKGIFGIFSANSKDEDVIIYDNEKRQVLAVLPFLRCQQKKEANKKNLCLADFIVPIESNITDYIGMFAISVSENINTTNAPEITKDDYTKLMIKILSFRLVEAFSEYLHYKVRTDYWGYNPNEKLDINEILKGKYPGIRPAPGYPSIPDHSLKKTIFELLKVSENIGTQLTETFMMIPPASITGFYFANPDAHYFMINKISPEQKLLYCNKKNWKESEFDKWISI